MTLCGHHLPKDQAWDRRMFPNPQISTGPAQVTEGVTLQAS